MSAAQIIVCDDSDSLNRQVAQYFVDVAREAVRARGRYMIALSGGSTPRQLYELLAQPPWRAQIDWPHVHIFLGDERLVPPDHKDSNYRMIYEALLSKVPLAEQNIHRVPTESGTPDSVAARYEETIRQDFGAGADETPRFDLNLLGLGENGHTASLFPHSKSLHEIRRLVVAGYVEELKSQRITMTLPLLNNSSHIVFLVSGKTKATVVREVVSGPSDPERLPAQLIRPSNGTLVWMVDKAAAAELPPELIQTGQLR